MESLELGWLLILNKQKVGEIRIGIEYSVLRTQYSQFKVEIIYCVKLHYIYHIWACDVIYFLRGIQIWG